MLVAALAPQPGATLVSICSAGDNALAMLTLDPARVIVVDLSAAQIACLRSASPPTGRSTMRAFLELMGSRARPRRGATARRRWRRACAPAVAGVLARPARPPSIAYGLGGIGKFERYFRIFRRYLLPLVHNRATDRRRLFVRATAAERAGLLRRGAGTSGAGGCCCKLFFSRFVMGRLGRDPAFFDHVEGSVADHVARRIAHAAVDHDPADNPYLHWILHGHARRRAAAAPGAPSTSRPSAAASTASTSATARSKPSSSTGEKADGFNLSDIFEYMTPETFAAVYGSILGAAKPGARLVYWNMMAPRRVPPAFAGARAPAAERRGARQGRRQGVLLFRLRRRGGRG